MKQLQVDCFPLHVASTTRNSQAVEHCYSSILTSCRCTSDDETVTLVRDAHMKLQGISLDSAKYQLLQAVSKLPSYAWSAVFLVHGHNGLRVYVGVGPEGVIVCNKSINDSTRFGIMFIIKHRPMIYFHVIVEYYFMDICLLNSVSFHNFIVKLGMFIYCRRCWIRPVL